MEGEAEEWSPTRAVPAGEQRLRLRVRDGHGEHRQAGQVHVRQPRQRRHQLLHAGGEGHPAAGNVGGTDGHRGWAQGDTHPPPETTPAPQCCQGVAVPATSLLQDAVGHVLRRGFVSPGSDS